MSGNTGIKNWRNWIPILVVAVIAASIVIAFQNRQPSESTSTFSPLAWFGHFVNLSDAIMLTVGPCLMAAAILLQRRRMMPLAWGMLAFCVLRIVAEAAYYFSDDPGPVPHRTQLYIVISATAAAAGSLTLIALLLLPQLRPPWRIVQIIAIGATLVLFISYELIYLHWMSSTPLSIQILRIFAAVIEMIAVPTVAFLTVFRPLVAPHAPPIDAGHILSLTCPRCQSAQSIPTNGGRCKNCQLDIFVALKEGTCRKCHYPLRGLTSTVCPECGTTVVANPA